MAEWKKVVVSGSNISQLNNDAGYLESVGAGIVSSSAQISYTGITDVPAGIVSGSSQITLGGDLSGTANSATVEAIQGVSLTSGEATQLANIESTTISSTQWGYLGVMDQNVRTTDSVTFATASVSQNLTVGGDLLVQGDLTYINTTNTLVEDQFILLGSGSAGSDVGIIFNTTAIEPLGGIALFWDSDIDRLSLSEGIAHDVTAVTPASYVPLVYDVDGASHTAVAKTGNIKIESGEAYIYV